MPTDDIAGRAGHLEVATTGDVAERMRPIPEVKALRPDGEPCGRGTVGLFQSRPVAAGEIKLVGKESNRLEDRFTGLLTIDDPCPLGAPRPGGSLWCGSLRPPLGVCAMLIG